MIRSQFVQLWSHYPPIMPVVCNHALAHTSTTRHSRPSVPQDMLQHPTLFLCLGAVFGWCFSGFSIGLLLFFQDFYRFSTGFLTLVICPSPRSHPRQFGPSGWVEIPSRKDFRHLWRLRPVQNHTISVKNVEKELQGEARIYCHVIHKAEIPHRTCGDSTFSAIA